MCVPAAAPNGTMDADSSGSFDGGSVVTVELPDALAAEVDRLVADGVYPDRAAAVRAAIRRSTSTADEAIGRNGNRDQDSDAG